MRGMSFWLKKINWLKRGNNGTENNYRIPGNHCTAAQKVQQEQEANRAGEAIGIRASPQISVLSSLQGAIMKRLKFNNTITTVDNIRFHSKKESKRYLELKLLERCGEITDLVLQPKYELKCGPKLEKVCSYSADFSYIEGGLLIVEDVKSVATKTPVYRLKKKLMRILNNIDIKEV